MIVPALGVSNILLRLASYRWLMVSCSLLFALIAFFVSVKEPEAFTAYARLLPPQTNTSTADAILKQVGGDSNLGAASLSLKSPSDLYASLFVSRSVQFHVMDKYQLGRFYQLDDQDDLLTMVRKKTYVDVGKDGIITIGYTAPDPQLAADITNSMIAAMYQLSKRLARQEAERRERFYTKLIDQAREELAGADARLSDLERQTGLTRLRGQEEATATALAELRGLIASREVELAKLYVGMTDRHPDVIALKQELAALRAQLGRLEDKNKARQIKNNVFVPFNSYIDKKDLVEPARREIDMRTKVLEQLIQVKALSQVDETRDLSVIQVLDPAIPPTKKSGPKVKFNTLAASIVGFIFGILLALVWEIMFSDPARRERWKRVFRAIFRLSVRSVPPPPESEK